MIHLKQLWATTFLLGFMTRLALAIPVVSVDTNHILPAIQTHRSVMQGDQCVIDLVISGVESNPSLHGFQFDLQFNSQYLDFISVTKGSFIEDPTTELTFNPDDDTVTFALAHLGDQGFTDSGILASLTFQALSPGTSLLDLAHVILSAPYGEEITPVELNGGSLTVLDQESPVIPEPPPWGLVFMGLSALLIIIRIPYPRAVKS